MTHYITIEQVTARYHICRMTLLRWGNDPTKGFPKPYQFGRRKLWSSAELDAWDCAHRSLPGLPRLPGAQSAA